MTRTQKIDKLQRAYTVYRLNHRPTATVWAKLRDTVTRDLIAYVKAHKRRAKPPGASP